MTIQEQNTFLSKEYAEAIRYMNNAKEALQKSQKDDYSYKDKKYVRSACGIAYSGVLVALDAWLEAKGVVNPKKNGRKSVDFYKRHISMLDKNMSDKFETAYEVLHLVGYYDGITNVKIITEGFDAAYQIIEKIKPENPVEIVETGLEKVKHKLDRMFMFLTVFFRIV
jgi:hypothetical protein